MNIYCFLSLVVGVLITLSLEWFIKRKNQIQEKAVKYRYFVATLIVLSLLGALLGTLINSKGEELGSWADWASAIGTVGAFIWGFIAITKQTSIQRAMNIEDKRPRFSFENTNNIQKGEIVLRCDDEDDTTPSGIEKRLNKNEGLLFRISNISENPIYSLKIMLYYKNKDSDDKKYNKRNTYVYHGMPQGGSIVLIPTEFMKKWRGIFIRFRSSASEVGYMYCEAGKSVCYYFVKDKNADISTYGNDNLITMNDKVVKEFKKGFKNSNPSNVVFKASSVIKKK